MAALLKRQSLRKQIMQVVMACLAIAAIFITISIQLVEINLSTKRLANDLETVGEIIGNRSIASLRFSDQQAAKSNLAAAKFNNNIDKLCLYDATGQLFSQYLSSDATASKCSDNYLWSFENQKFYITGGIINLAIPLIEENELLGTLALTGNLSTVSTQQFYMLALQLLIFLAAAAICYFIAGQLLAKKLTPLVNLNKLALTIVNDPFSTQRSVLENNDEIGDLVTAFNQVLDNLADENSAVLDSEHRFRTLADHSPIGIYLRDMDGNILYGNEKWYEYTGINSEQSIEDFYHNIDPTDRSNYKATLEKTIQDSSVNVVEYHCNAPGSHKRHALMEYMAPLQEQDANQRTVSGIIGSVMDITDLKSAQLELEKLAFYDPLTQLPNRRFFSDHLNFRLAAAKKGHTPLAILLLDLDNFKRINDSLGHDSGDRLLAVIAKRLRDEVFSEDVVSRMGGDEFIIFIESASSDQMIETITQRILQVVTKPVNISRHAIEITCSMGVARYPKDADSAEDLIRNADIALYKAKALGKNCVASFSKELDQFVQEKVHLETQLRRAILRNAFELYVQPQYDGESQRFVWGEMLLRWKLPSGEFISPDKFIPVAEETGLIVRLGNWVFRETCQTLAKYGSELAAIGIDGLSVNLSARQFYHKGFISYFRGTINEFGIDPNKIEIEITESMVMEDVTVAISRMKKLRDIGFRISIDDFGTGYSSLSYLKNFNIDAVKIDKSFIDELPFNENNAAITTAVLAMADKLSLAVVAEGVETIDQSEFLLAHGCKVMQGYLFARPQPISQLLAMQLPLQSYQTQAASKSSHRTQN